MDYQSTLGNNMAASYRLVVSSVNCYRSTVVDRRVQRSVHYCAGACGLQEHGLECTVAHRSVSCGPSISQLSSPPRPAGAFVVEEDYQQSPIPVVSRTKKGSSVLNLTSLKDITGEAINLASGKAKEFSPDHVPFKRGRKARPDSLARRSTDLNLLYGCLVRNDENHSSFGLLQKSAPEQQGNGAILEPRTATSFSPLPQTNESTEGNLFSRILERGKTNTGTLGEDIRACLDILLRCSDDLSKCNDFIRQCIRRKCVAGGKDSDPDIDYQSIMAMLPGYLKRLPFGFEQNLSARLGCDELAELISCLHEQQRSVLFHVLGNGQPPSNEHIIHSTPMSTTLPPSPSGPETGMSLVALISPTAPLVSHDGSMFSSSEGCGGEESLDFLYIEEKEADVGMVSDGKIRGQEKVYMTSGEVRSQVPRKLGNLTLSSDGCGGEALASSSTGTWSSEDNDAQQIAENTSSELGPLWQSVQSGTKANGDRLDTDTMVEDSELLSRGIDEASRLRGCSPRTDTALHFTPGSKRRASPEAPSPHSVASLGEPCRKGTLSGTAEEEGDGALLLRILDSIESFAQELVDASVSTSVNPNVLAQQQQVMRLLQDTLAVATNASGAGHRAKLASHAQAGDPGSTLLIQQAPEVIRIQINPEKKPGIENYAHAPVPNHVPLQPPVPELAPVLTPVPDPAPLQPPVPDPAPLQPPVPDPAPVLTPVPDHAPLQPPVPELAPVLTPVPDHTPLQPLVPDPAPLQPLVPDPAPVLTPVPDHAPLQPPVPEPAPVLTPVADHAPLQPPVPDPAPLLTPVPDHVPLQPPVPDPAPLHTPVPDHVPLQPCFPDHPPLHAPDQAIPLISAPDCTPVPDPALIPTPDPTPTPSSPASHAPTPLPSKVMLDTPASVCIPPFYFPRGALAARDSALDQTIGRIEMAFAEFEEQRARIHDMGKIAKACGCPLYWKAPLFRGTGGQASGCVSFQSFVATWRKLLNNCHDDASKFVYLLARPNCNYLEQEDFVLLLQDIVDSHPGLTFLKDTPEFHTRYITTVIQRIFYRVNRSWTGRVTVAELRRSNFLQTLAQLEEEDDIDQMTDYFSYQHFYVIYCKFWELDSDHDLFVDQRDLAKYGDHASSERIIERLFSGAVTRHSAQCGGRMSYAEFVWFLISEEDKRSLTSVEYWFRCMDLDGDGVLSMYELEYFYEEQRRRMEDMGIEPLPFHDLLCQMLDLVKPRRPGKITLSDLKRCGNAHLFYDTFFSLEKYLEHEQRDPFLVQKDEDSGCMEPTDWDRFAAGEYEVLVAEDTSSEEVHQQQGSPEGDGVA